MQPTTGDCVLAAVLPGIRLDSLNSIMRIASLRGRLAQAQKAKIQRSMVWLVLTSRFGPRPPKLPVCVTITRVAPRKLDSHDNLRASAKHVVDEIAEWLRVDDSSNMVTWRFEQEKNKRYAVKLVIRSGSKQVNEYERSKS